MKRITKNRMKKKWKKKLKKRKRRKKHEMLMEKMKQQGKGKYNDSEENKNEENKNEVNKNEEYKNEEEEHNNNVSAEENTKKRRPGRPSKNKQQEKQRQEEEEPREEEKPQNTISRNYDSFRNNANSGNNRNSTVSNDGEPVKQKRKRRKKKEMEALRAQGLIGKGPSSQYNINRNSEGNTNVAGAPGQEENKMKRRRGRPKLSGNTQNNAVHDKSKTNDGSKGMDIRRYWSKNDDNNNTGMNGSIVRKTSSNNFIKENEKRRDQNERGGDKPRSIFSIITSARENEGFMKKTPSEIEQLERNYKHNVKTGVTCIPLNYQENGGGMCIIFIDADTQYGPIKNLNGFMTFLVLECDAEQFFIETGITHNVIECEKHMQLLISPGDTYTFKNMSHELEAKLLLIACNKMTVPLDLKNHIRDPTVNQEKG